MSALRVLFVGGSGIISASCSTLAVEQGIDLTVLNRGRTSLRPLPGSCTVLQADIRNAAAARAALGDREFDVVVNWVAFTPDHVASDLEVFGGRARQYVFISSASAYQTPPARVPVTESTPLANPYWAYSRDKIACEALLVRAYREDGFPATIVRPSHTYDQTSVPYYGGWTILDRMRRGRPVVVQGDGTSLWTLTHSSDFAAGFVPLLGHSRVVGEAVHITSDDVLAWNQIVAILGAAAGVEPEIVHVTSDAIAGADPAWGAALLGDSAHSMTFDNAKLRRLVPAYAPKVTLEMAARDIVAWHDAEPSRRQIDPELDALMDRLASHAPPSR